MRLPIESTLWEEHCRASSRTGELDKPLRDQVGQLGFIAALSGLRSVVGDLLFIETHGAWERGEWGRLSLLFRAATTLQPHSILFWEMAAWHMGWNASVAALNDTRLPNEIMRRQAAASAIAIGKDFLVRGIRNNPDRPQLYEALGRLYREKLHDHAAAADCYATAANRPGAAPYDERFAAYELSHVGGRERDAYRALRRLYERGAEQRLPTLIGRMKFLEERLDIPPDQRITETVK